MMCRRRRSLTVGGLPITGVSMVVSSRRAENSNDPRP